MSAQAFATFGELARHGLLRPLLERQVMAACLGPEEVSDDNQRQALGQFCSRHSLESEEALEAFLQQEQLSLDDLLWQVSLPLRLASHAQRLYGPRAEQRFLERKMELDQVVYSLLRVQDPGLARELYLRIASGEASFSELADRFAEGPERASRGIIGPVPLTKAHPVLAEKLRTNPCGQLMQPFPVEQWWLVVRPERLIPASFDAAMAERMAQELFEEWVAEEVDRKLRQLDMPQASTPIA